MNNDDTKGAGFGALAFGAIFVSFFLLAVWGWTAQFPWSSERWLVAIPITIVLAGIVSSILLLLIAAKRLFCPVPETPDQEEQE